jgi:hypothetical protein
VQQAPKTLQKLAACRTFIVPEIVTPPIVCPQRLRWSLRVAEGQGLAEGMMAVEAHDLAKIDVGHAQIAARDDQSAGNR